MSRKSIVVVASLLVGVLFVAGVVALILPLLVVDAQDLPRLLPADTLLYYRWCNTWKIVPAARESGVTDALLSSLPEDQRLRVRTALEGALRGLKSVHFIIHKVSLTERQVTDVDMLVVLETGIPGDLVSLLGAMGAESAAGPGFRRLSNEEGYPIYEIDVNEESGTIPSLFICSRSGLVLIATDQRLLEETIEAVDKRRRQDSLGENGAFRTLWTTTSHDVQGYISVGQLLPPLIRSHADVQQAIELFSLQEIDGVQFRTDYEKQALFFDLVFKKQGAGYHLLAQPVAPKAILDYLPADTALFLAGSFGDGRQTLSDFNAYVADFLHRIGEEYEARRYQQKFSEIERELNLDLAEAASLIVETGLIWRVDESEYPRSVPCIFARVRDREKAAGIMQRLGRARRNSPSETYRHLGEELHLFEADLVWTMIGEDILAGGRRTVESAIAAKKNGAAAGTRPPSWTQVKAHLPNSNSFITFADFRKFRQPVLPGKSSVDLACGATLTVADGVAHVSLAFNRTWSSSDSFKVLAEWLRDPRR